MSITSKAAKKSGTSSNRSDYRASFLRDIHRLIARGYARLTPPSFEGTIEEVITERLVVAINEAIQSSSAEPWMHRYHAVDNLPVSHPTKSGKKRPKVDIEITNARAGIHPQIHFEAKRLGRGYPVGKYLGRKGLGCIVAADYARGHDDAGMLGYVQSGTCNDWAMKIQNKLLNDRKSHNLLDGSGWETSSLTLELNHVYRSQHNRPSLAHPVNVYHTLLRFH